MGAGLCGLLRVLKDIAMNNPLTSYLRHWLSLQVAKIFTTLNLPAAGSGDVVDYLTEAGVLLVGWLVIKYVLPLLNDKSLRETFQNFGSGGSNGAASLLMGILGLAALFVFCGVTSSCADLNVRGSVHYRDAESGAKGGLNFVPGSPPLPFFRAPIRDSSGEVVGAVDLQSGK